MGLSEIFVQFEYCKLQLCVVIFHFVMVRFFQLTEFYFPHIVPHVSFHPSRGFGWPSPVPWFYSTVYNVKC